LKLESSSITNENAAALLDRGLTAIRAGDTAFDLSAVATVDSAAVALLLAWQRAAIQQGRRLELSGAPAGIASLAELYGVQTLLQAGGPDPAAPA